MKKVALFVLILIPVVIAQNIGPPGSPWDQVASDNEPSSEYSESDDLPPSPPLPGEKDTSESNILPPDENTESLPNFPPPPSLDSPADVEEEYSGENEEYSSEAKEYQSEIVVKKKTTMPLVAIILAVLVIVVAGLALFLKRKKPDPLTSYVTSARAAGMSDFEISNILKQSGWDDASISRVLEKQTTTKDTGQ